MTKLFEEQKNKKPYLPESEIYRSARQYWENPSSSKDLLVSPAKSSISGGVQFSSPIQIISHRTHLTFSTLAIVL